MRRSFLPSFLPYGLRRCRQLIGVGVLGVMLSMAVLAQNRVFSTHDHTLSVLTPEPIAIYPETWADVKMPGGFPSTQFDPNIPPTPDTRRTYVVGTIGVSDATGAVPFSGSLALPSFGAGFSIFPAQRQVAMLQCNDAANGIVWQRYFYGLTPATPSEPLPIRATNARGISVWAAPDDDDTRIAICGETYDEVLPLSQAPAGWAAANPFNPSGFIAVYDGTGALLWTHHFFDPGNPGTEDCAITDVSIRVDAAGTDIVTYCGISSHGLLAAGTALSPLLAFLPPPGGCTGGAPLLPAGQWDGIVGRLLRPPAALSAPVFHSIVGGPGQDGLFGIAEITPDRFAVVGSAETMAVGGFPFPLQCALAGPYVLGALLVFDASLTPPGLLTLAWGSPLGTPGAGIHTLARDVHVGHDAFPNVGIFQDMLYVVGSTDDAFFTAGGITGTTFAIPPPPAQSVLSGPTDGFVAAFIDQPLGPPPGFFSLTFSYWGGAGEDGLTGINGWSEFSEHFTVTGFTNQLGSNDIGVQTFFFNNAIGPALPPGSTAPPNGSLQLLAVRQDIIGGGAEDRPTVMGATCATTVGLAFLSFGLNPGQEAGGGVAVGPEGRANAVGRTSLPLGGYPVVGVGARGPDFGLEAVRTELDLLPPSPGVLPGVGRTDGTGFMGGVPAPPFPLVLPSLFTGGTTPFCAQSEFGLQIGLPAPSLQRMLIDFEGILAPLSTDAAITITRPTAQVGSIAAGVLQIGLPPAVPWAFIPPGTEIWLGGGIYALFPAVGVNQAFRLPLAALTGTGSFSAQLVCLLAVPAPAPGCPGPFLWSASPALWFSY